MAAPSPPPAPPPAPALKAYLERLALLRAISSEPIEIAPGPCSHWIGVLVVTATDD